MATFQIEVNDKFFEVKESLQYDNETMNFEVWIDNRKVVFAADDNGDISPIWRGLNDRDLLRAIGNKIESHYL